MTKEEAALLDAIARSESAGDWNVIYGGSKFNDYSKHPQKFVTIKSGPNKGDKSSAAGKYQITYTTYKRVAPELGITDFSPESQQKIALYLAREKYGPSLAKDLAAGKASDVAAKLAGVWTSLPGGIEAGTNSKKFANAYTSALNAPRPPGFIPGVASEMDTGTVLNARSAGGSVAPPPLPRPRPDTSLPFDPLPAPPPLVPRSAGVPQDAMFGVRAPKGTYKPGDQMAPATDAELSAVRPMNASMQSLVAPQSVSPPMVAPFRPMPVTAPTMDETRAEMRPTPGMVRQFPPPPVVRPGAGMGAVAGMGGAAGAVQGVVPPTPNAPRYVPPALPRVGPIPPVVPPSPRGVVAPPPVTATPPAPPAAPSGGFDFGAALGGLGSNITAGLTNAGQALGTTATNAIEGTKTALGNTAQSATDLLKNELIGTVKGRTLLLNTALGLPAPGTRDPQRYGATFADRQEAARRREAMAYGLPYVPQQTGVRSSLSVRPDAPVPKVPAPRTNNRPAPRNTGRWEGVLDQFGMIL